LVFKQKQAEKPFYRRHGYLLSIRKETLCSLENSDPARYDSSEKELYERVKEAAQRWGSYTTIIRIQRTFNIGFPKAGMYYARLQAEGIIGTDNGKIG
jgi:hypothetical protein